MGGKHKQAQRTKNNARPSSSGRSAELLGSNVPPFVGFSLTKETGFTLPGLSLPLSDDLDKLLDTNFQLVLKKMNKKDSTTKLKALQEFAELTKNSEPEAVKAVLSFWPRLYNILATDTDHRVREAAHVAHLQVVLKAKRNLAPFLKQLIAPWFTSQYDTYAPAASAASQSFQAAFPPNKIQEAIVFCQEEILTYIVDNLTVQTAQTLSNPKTITTEDAEARYERILISSLQGYSLYLNKVSSENIQSASELNLKIISNSRFWKLSKHNVPPIRAAFYNVLTVICQKAPFLIEKERGHISNAVFVNLDECEPTVLLSVWEAALMVVTSVEDWWTYISVEKLLLPKLFKVLREGGQGNASVIYPNLLPFISKLPPTLDKNLFFQNYFENMCLGLKQKNVIASKSESVAVATALIECIRYIILKNQSEIVLCEKIIKSYLISVIEWCLIENQASCKTIFNQTAALIQYWSRQVNNTEFSNYPKFLHYFWSNITSLFQGVLLNLEQSYDAEKINQIAERQIELLTSLKHTFKPRKQLKVQFTSESSTETEPGERSTTTLHSDQSYNESLIELVYNVCESYVKIISAKKCKNLLEILYSLMQDFESENFFLHLSKMVEKEGSEGKLINIYNNLLLKWLKCSYLCSKPIVDLIFLVFKYLENTDREQILSTLCEVSDENCLGWTVAEALSHPHNKDPLVQKWLSNKKVSEFLVAIVDKELSDECPPDLSILLKLALTENELGQLFISEEAVKIIVEKLTKTLLTPNAYSLTIDTCSSLASYMASIIYTDNLLMHYGENLLLGLFVLSCNDKIDPDILSKDTLWEVNTAWQDALTILAKHLPKKDLEVLVKKFASTIQEQFLIKEVHQGNLTHAIVNCIRALYKSVPLQVNEFLKIFFESEYIPNWKNYITNVCIVAEYVKGNLCCPYENLKLNEIKDVIQEIHIPKYFVWSYIKIDVLSKTLEENCDNYDNDDEDDNTENPPLILKVTDDPEHYVLNNLYDLTLGFSYLENFKTVKYYGKIKHYYNLMKSKLQDTIKSNICNITQIERLLKERMNADAWIWCKCSYLWHTEIAKNNNNKKMCDIYEDLLKGDTINNNLSVLHLTQIYAKHLSFDYVKQQGYNTVESSIVLRSLIHCDEIDVQIAEVFGKIEKLRSQNVPLFLYDSSNISWKQTQEILEVIRLFTNLVQYKFKSLSRKHWDFGVLSLVSWSSNIVKVKSKCCNLDIQPLIVAIAEFYVSIDNCIKDLKEENPNNSYINEWEDLFVQSIHNDIVQMWMFLAEKLEPNKGIEAVIYLPLIQEFSVAINHFNHKFIFNNDGTLPKWSKFLKRCFSLLVNSNTMLQLWGYKMLLILVPGLVDIDFTAVHTNTPHENGLIFEQFKEVLVRTHEIVNAMLLGFKLGEDSCRVEEFTDSFTYTMAYLLLWDVLLTLCEKSSTELRYQYADWLKEEDLLKNLLNNLFRLMPAEILHQIDNKSKVLPELFTNKPSLDIRETCTSETVEHLVCWIYALSLFQLPALVRQWWSGTDTRIAQIVERVTTLYVSSQLCAQELSDVACNVTPFKNMVIKVIPSVREVLAVYTVDEAQMELVITLPMNYPLGGPDVQCNRQIGGTSHKQWLMQLKKCVLHQNGRIWDGLNLWNNNLDKKFDGVEECYICFAVLHPGTYQLPKLSCQTCKKKFHSACLYKWFSTSNKSTCPICRNLF